MKRNRSTLKDYFKKGAIPTEANFADLIDSMLNQDEDSLSKLPNDPLHITPNGADEGLINFYRLEQGEEKLSWQIKQKPDGRSGLGIGDNTTSRLYIENGTGNIGVGTTTPANKLHLHGDSGNLALTFTNSANTAGKRGYRIAFDNDRITFQRADDAGGFVANQISIMQDTGNVGIGTITPNYLLSFGGILANTKLAIWDGGPNGNAFGFGVQPSQFRLHLNQSSDRFSFLDSAAGTNELFTIKGDGKIGIGTANPGAKLDIRSNTAIAGGWYEAIRFSQEQHAAITHPGGGLLFGLHSNRNFYFADIKDGVFQKYVVQIAADTGNVIFSGNAFFGAVTRQMLNLWSTSYGIGVQSGTQYYRTGANFAWYAGGSHNDNAIDAGGGTRLMWINSGALNIDVFRFQHNGGDFVISYAPRGSGGRALVHDFGNALGLNYAGDFTAGIRYWGALSQQSSKEIKENFIDLTKEEAFTILEGLNPWKFNLIRDENKALHIGFIAEEVPDEIATNDRKAIVPNHILAVLTKVVKEQQKTIEALTQKVNSLTI